MVTLDKEQVGGGEAAAAFAVKPQQAGTESSIEAQREANAAEAQGRANVSGYAAASGGTLAAQGARQDRTAEADGITKISQVPAEEVLFFRSLGFSNYYIIKIYDLVGDAAIALTQDNAFWLLEEFPRLGFPRSMRLRGSSAWRRTVRTACRRRSSLRCVLTLQKGMRSHRWRN